MAQEYATQQDLLIDTNKGDLEKYAFSSSIIGIEKVRVEAANKIRNIDLQIKKIKSLKDDFEELQYISSSIPALIENKLLKELDDIESSIATLQSKYTNKDRVF